MPSLKLSQGRIDQLINEAKAVRPEDFEGDGNLVPTDATIKRGRHILEASFLGGDIYTDTFVTCDGSLHITAKLGELGQELHLHLELKKAGDIVVWASDEGPDGRHRSIFSTIPKEPS